ATICRLATEANFSDLFPMLAWKWMEEALRPSQLNKLYLQVIQASHPDSEKRGWDAIVYTVEKVMDIPAIRHQIKAMLFKLKILPGEPPLTFVARVRRLVEVARAKNLGSHLSEIIYNTLPAMGRELVDAKLKHSGGISELTDYESLLDYLSVTNTAFHGTRIHPGAFIAHRWAPHAWIQGHDYESAPRQLATPVSKKPKPQHQGASRAPVGTTAVNTAPATATTTVVGPRRPFEPRADPNRICDHPFCVDLAKFKKTSVDHTNNNCLRKEPMPRQSWYALLNSHSEIEKAIRDAGRWPVAKPFKPAAAAITTTTTASVKRQKKGGRTPVVSSIKRKASPEVDEDGDSAMGPSEEFSYDYETINRAIPFSYPSSPNVDLAREVAYVRDACAAKGSNDVENRMVSPIEIESQPFSALIDPGANVSFISAKVAAQLGLELTSPQRPTIRLANGSVIEIKVTASEVNLLVNCIELSAIVYVMDLA
ncbi:hypothetical protein BGW39_003557, partial [Mortierella sp. 14UC]